MRIAIISDIHGNAVALETVLADVERAGADRIVCLGDVALTGPQPREAIARVRALGCPVVMGNTDGWLLHPHHEEPENEMRRKMGEIAWWCVERLTDDDRAFLASFQPTVPLDLPDGRSLLCFHGSPRSYLDVILATTPDDELAEKLGGATATILAGGHTHVPMVRRFRRSLLLNPGSVGLPFLRLAPDVVPPQPPQGEYAILTAEDGTLGIELRRVPLSLTAIAAMAHRSGMPHADWWVAGWTPAEEGA
jgi:predicted phosphodiesterase